MMIVEKPFVSEPLKEWLQESQHPVLRNQMACEIAQEGWSLNLIDAPAAAARIDAGERVLTNSENALAWVVAEVHDERLLDCIHLFKSKAEMRERLRPLDPSLFFETFSFEELRRASYEQFPSHFAIKPEVGFCSMGVHVVDSRESYAAARAGIERERAAWQSMYPSVVIDADRYIVEGYIEGDEFAVEAFYDADGKAHVIGVCQHVFASGTDVSDRLYETSPALMTKYAGVFEEWLNEVNAIIGARDMAIHPELRVNSTGVHAIEFNPMRFMGLGATDLTYFAYGMRTCQVFLEDDVPNFEELFADSQNKRFATMVLNPPVGTAADAVFDYAALEERLPRVMDLRKFAYGETGLFGFYLLDISEATEEQMQFILTDDLSAFIKEAAN